VKRCATSLVAAIAAIGCTTGGPRLRPAAPANVGQRAASSQSALDPSQSATAGDADEPSSDSSFDDDQAEDVDTTEFPVDAPRKPHPLANYSAEELRKLYLAQPSSLGSVSIGRPNAGRLLNGVRPNESALYHLVDPAHAWGTTETVEALCHALQVVAEQHPGTARVDIGHLSAATGGPLSPHHSHQSGRDVDLGFYYAEPSTRWYTRASGESLDLPRTWALIRTLATETDIEMILLDIRLQQALEGYALRVERDADWVHRLFHGASSRPALVRHSPGHATHLHLRFRNPVSTESGRRVSGFITPPVPYEQKEVVAMRYHTAIAGDTLAKLAERYHTTMDAIRHANRMQTYQLVAGHRYGIPTSATQIGPRQQAPTHVKAQR